MGQRLGVTEDFLATGHERHEESARLVEAELALRLDELDLAAQLYEEALDGATRYPGTGAGGTRSGRVRTG